MSPRYRLEWKEPPEQTTLSQWETQLLPLMERPGIWASVAQYDTQNGAGVVASNLRRGHRQIPPGRWDFKAADGEVYAKYLGPDEQPEES